MSLIGFDKETAEKIKEIGQKTGYTEGLTNIVDSCIEQGILSDFLTRNREEVINSLLLETIEEGLIDHIENSSEDENEVNKIE